MRGKLFMAGVLVGMATLLDGCQPAFDALPALFCLGVVGMVVLLVVLA